MLITAVVSAQPRLSKPEFYLGIHGGVSAGTVIFRPAVANMTPIMNACVLGGNGGLVFRYAGHKYCHFQMELNYQHKGWATYSESAGHNYHNLHYLELPILMNLNFGSDVCRWFFNLGPQIGYCLWDENKSIDHPFDWGMAAGTGLYVNTRKAGIYELEIRFDYSFGGVYGTSITDTYNMASPMDLSVNLAWLMPVRKVDKRKIYEEKERKKRIEEEKKRQEEEQKRIEEEQKKQEEIEREYQVR